MILLLKPPILVIESHRRPCSSRLCHNLWIEGKIQKLSSKMFMKRLLFLGLGIFTLARAADGATNSYVNTGTFLSPPSTFPSIDATNVSNLGLFDVQTPITFSQLTDLPQVTPFDFSDMQNFT